MTGLLVVDDEEGVRRSLRKALSGEDYALFFAENGREALNVVRSESASIDIVVCDLKMPGIDGLETLVEIARTDPEITRIILTGYATMDNAVISLNAGIDGFLTKPFDNRELRQKIRELHLRKKLRQFVSEQVLREMQNNGGSLAPRSREATVLFIDIRRFSQISESLSPEGLSNLLGHYFTLIDNVICEFNGTVDKHIGDGIMGVFGAPISYGDDAGRAVNAALAIVRDIPVINRQLAESGISISIGIGIGIGTGEVMAGIFGSNRKKEYTVFGSAVNFASRLEGLAGENEILVCANTKKRIEGEFTTDRMELPGGREGEKAVEIYRVMNDFRLMDQNSIDN